MSEPLPPARLNGPLDGVNDSFHEAYDRNREWVQLDEPVLVSLADDLVLFGGKVRGHAKLTFRVTSPELVAIKSIAHAPVALWLLLQRPADTPDQLRLGANALQQLRAFITRSGDDPILKDTLAWMDRMPFDPEEFAAALGPRLREAIAKATTLQLEALDVSTDDALSRLSAEERRGLHVAVTGDHQARERSLPMQYFRKRFADPDRVVYAEGVTDADEAAALVGKQRLDRKMAKAFFGDPKRMQRDLLGDAAKAELAKARLTRIDTDG